MENCLFRRSHETAGVGKAELHALICGLWQFQLFADPSIVLLLLRGMNALIIFDDRTAAAVFV